MDKVMDAELRTKVNKLLDFFTEPDQGDKYLKDLEDDLVGLIRQEIAKARISERKKIALDYYRGKTVSESTNWQAMFEHFMEGNELAIKDMAEKLYRYE